MPGHVYAGPRCPRCQVDLLPGDVRSGLCSCRECRADYEAVALQPPPLAVSQPAVAGPEGTTPCAAHPGNAASADCGRCGVMMCGLCRIDADGQRLCPGCYERLAAEGALASARTSFRDYRSLATLAAAVGVVLFVAGAVIGPATVLCAWRARQQKLEWGDEGGYAGVWVLAVVGMLETLAGVAFIVTVAGA